MTIVAVQCRLSSTRLPEKALLPLGGKTVLDWTLAAMKNVAADDYYVASDEDSADRLLPVCKRNGFKLFTGPLEDVLERYCMLIEKTGADIVVRATADNPFLFYEAASALADEFGRLRETEDAAYMTYTGLPHGSGVEVFSGKKLLEARGLTSEPYDHEHVGPALYNHADRFTCIMAPAPRQWNCPEYRTTIDTYTDYRRAQSLVRFVSGKSFSEKNPIGSPYTAEQIVRALGNPELLKPVLCVPCVKKGKGTGHLRRCLQIALSIGADVYIPEDAGLEEKDDLVREAVADGLSEMQITKRLPGAGEYSLILTDAFTLERELALALARAAPIAAVDEGSLNADLCDCLVDIIPSYGIERPANISDPSFVSLPEHKRTKGRVADVSDIQSILVTVGGEDPADLVVPSCIAFASTGKKITGVVENPEEAFFRVDEPLRKFITFKKPVHNLKERLFEYDVVVTHYGFTAFEAVAAGCGVILLGTSPLHISLAQKYGFANISTSQITPENAALVLENTAALYPDSPFSQAGAGRKNLPAFVKQLADGRRFPCPVCRDSESVFDDAIVARTTMHTFRRCHLCGMMYMAWTFNKNDAVYDSSYFFEDYKKQYGRTYLDDFKHIKSQCVRRMSSIDFIYRGRGAHKAVTPSVLDVGCAYGPYLDAANDAGWQVFGIDVSQDAVDYVQNELHYPASCVHFPDFDPVSEFGMKNFDAVTMWYVIEHFQNLDGVLKTVSRILKTGGIFAFSTPSASGVSGRFSPQSFFQNSPADHYTLWEPGKTASILRRYGFKVCKTVSTGHHPERFPNVGAETKPTSLKYALYSGASHFFGLGDTFEVYCKKEKDLQL